MPRKSRTERVHAIAAKMGKAAQQQLEKSIGPSSAGVPLPKKPPVIATDQR